MAPASYKIVLVSKIAAAVAVPKGDGGQQCDAAVSIAATIFSLIGMKAECLATSTTIQRLMARTVSI